MDQNQDTKFRNMGALIATVANLEACTLDVRDLRKAMGCNAPQEHGQGLGGGSVSDELQDIANSAKRIAQKLGISDEVKAYRIFQDTTAKANTDVIDASKKAMKALSDLFPGDEETI